MAFTLPDISAPPTVGYGEPYRGTSELISVKDSRTDWTISEGKRRITSEQALELTGDQDYETRREELNRYNHELYAQAKHHHTWGYVWMIASAGLAVGGVAYGFEGTRSQDLAYAAYAAAVVGVIAYYYAHRAASVPPPYITWKTPTALDRPAYVRQQTEAYNAKHGGAAPTSSDDDQLGVAPGQRGHSVPAAQAVP
jgi:hypothetical protein